MKSHVKEHPAWFHRFDVSWTPTALILDPRGVERYRIEGYLPTLEFRARLEMGLGRVAFQNKKFQDAEKLYEGVANGYANTSVAPDAEYWAGVSHYQATHDAGTLRRTAETLKSKYPQSVEAKKASVWLAEA